MADPLFESLDFIYSPSEDVAAELAEFEKVPGARVAFAIAEMGTRVAMVELTLDAPRFLLAGHLAGERPVFVYRVADLQASIGSLRQRGWPGGDQLELPMGPACVFTLAGGHRVGIYERTRPGVVQHFEGRRDF